MPLEMLLRVYSLQNWYALPRVANEPCVRPHVENFSVASSSPTRCNARVRRSVNDKAHEWRTMVRQFQETASGK